MIKIALAAAALTLAPTVASANVIDFENVDPTSFFTPTVVDGYNFDFSASGWFIGDPDDAFYPDGTTNGTNILVASGDVGIGGATMTMAQVGGGAFDLFGLDLASSNSTLANTVTVTGTLLGGGTVSTALAAGTSFASFDLLGFENLVSVVFQSVLSGGYNTAGFALDNLDFMGSADAVPLPAALPLLLAGLGGLGIARRCGTKA